MREALPWGLAVTDHRLSHIRAVTDGGWTGTDGRQTVTDSRWRATDGGGLDGGLQCRKKKGKNNRVLKEIQDQDSGTGPLWS